MLAVTMDFQDELPTPRVIAYGDLGGRGRVVSKLGDLGLAEKSTNTTSDVTRFPAALVDC